MPEVPTVGVAAQQPEHEQRVRGRERDGAAPVDAARRLVARFGDLQGGHDDRAEADRDVQEEDRLPADGGGQRTADERAERHGDADRRAVDGGGERALRSAPLLREQRERHGEHDRAADALQRPREIEHRRGGRQPAQQRGEREDPDADGEHALAPETIGQRPRRQHERGERQRVCVDDPLQVGERGVEVPADARQGRVDDGDVEEQHERRHAHGDQRPPLAFHLSKSFPGCR